MWISTIWPMLQHIFLLDPTVCCQWKGLSFKNDRDDTTCPFPGPISPLKISILGVFLLKLLNSSKFIYSMMHTHLIGNYSPWLMQNACWVKNSVDDILIHFPFFPQKVQHRHFMSCNIKAYFSGKKIRKILSSAELAQRVVKFKHRAEWPLLTQSCWTWMHPVFTNSVDPNQWSGSALFAIKNVKLYQQPGSSNLIGCKLEVSMASQFIQHDKGYLLHTLYSYIHNWYFLSRSN